MATIANLNILLSLDDKASGALTKAGNNIQQWGQSLRNVGAGLTAGVTAPVLGMAVVAVKAASDLQESMSAVQQVYGDAADTVVQSSLEAAQAVGLSQQEYLSTAAVLGVYGDTLGLTDSATADFSNSLIGAAADLGSFYNANTPEVLGAMQAALRGEFDPLERFGIMMNQAALEQYALEQGIWDGNGALTAQQRILAAQGFILDNMGNATGDFARTSGGLANQQKILKAQLKNTAAQMGAVLLPTITKAVTIFGELLTRFQNISPEWQRWIVIIGLAVAAIGPFLLVLGTILTMLPAIGAALAILTGPIGLAIAIIGLSTMAYLKNWFGFRDIVNSLARSAVPSLMRPLNALKKIFDGIASGNWRKALAGIGDLLSSPAKAIGDILKGIKTGFDPLDKVFTELGNVVTGFGRLIQEVFQGDVSGAISVLTGLFGNLLDVASGLGGLVIDVRGWFINTAAPAAMGWIADLVGGVWGWIKEKLGIGSTAGDGTGGPEMDGANISIGDWVLGVGIPALGGLIKTGFTSVWDWLKGQLPGITNLVGDIGAWTLNVAAPTVGGALANAGTVLLDKGRELLQGVLDGLNEKMPAVTAWLGLVGEVAWFAVGDLFETLKGRGKQLVAGVIQGWIERLENLKTELGLLATNAPGYVGDLALTLAGKGKQLIAGVLTGWYEAIPGLKVTLGFLGSTAVSAVDDLSRTLWSAGWDLIEGFALGILARIPYLEEVAALAAGIVSGIVSALNKISSPSRVMMELGGYMTEGLAIGIQRGIPQVEVAARGMAAAASTNVQADFGGQGGYGRGGGGGFENYGTYNEADRYWAPEQAMRRQTVRGSRR